MFDSQRSCEARGTGVVFRVTVIAGMLCASACHKTMPRVFVPPAIHHPVPAPPKLPANQDPPLLAAADLMAVPDLDLGSPTADIGVPPQPPPPPRPRSPIVTGPKPAPPPAAPEAPAPKIVQLFPAEQQRAYNRELDDILERDQRALEALARKNLDADQRDRMAQIHELLTQAKQAREQDLVTAVNLARRADTLAKDLLDRLP